MTKCPFGENCRVPLCPYAHLDLLPVPDQEEGVFGALFLRRVKLPLGERVRGLERLTALFPANKRRR